MRDPAAEINRKKNTPFLNFITNPKYLMVLATIGIFLIIYLAGIILYGDKGFSKLRTFMMLFIDNAYVGISAVGMTMVLITGGIDLSVAAVASLSGMLIAYGTTVLNIDPVVCMVFAILVGVALGFAMGAMITYLKIPPFVATLTGMFLARGVCSLISRESISINNSLIDALAGWKLYFMKYSGGEWVKIKPVAYINLNVVLFLVMIIWALSFCRVPGLAGMSMPWAATSSLHGSWACQWIGPRCWFTASMASAPLWPELPMRCMSSPAGTWP